MKERDDGKPLSVTTQIEEMISRLGYAAVRTPPMPQRLLGMAEARG